MAASKEKGDGKKNANLTYPNDDEDFHRLRKGLGESQRIVVVFTASWCGPCRRIKPFLLEEANKRHDVPMVFADVDACGDAGADHGVTALPSVMVADALKDGSTGEITLKEVDRTVGANEDELEKLFETHVRHWVLPSAADTATEKKQDKDGATPAVSSE